MPNQKLGRPLGTRNSELARAKIQTTKVLERLGKHIDGLVEMTPTQVRAAEILLRKTLPDLQGIQLEATVDDKRQPAELSDGELVDIAAAGSARVIEAPGGEKKPPGIH